MATTLKLIEVFKSNRRVNGDISFIQAQVVLDGIPTNVDFRSKVGEEPIILTEDTITVSDEQVEARRKATIFHAEQMARARADEQRDFEKAVRFMEADMDRLGASDEARAEMRDLYQRDPQITARIDTIYSGESIRHFERLRRDILTRHGLR